MVVVKRPGKFTFAKRKWKTATGRLVPKNGELRLAHNLNRARCPVHCSIFLLSSCERYCDLEAPSPIQKPLRGPFKILVDLGNPFEALRIFADLCRT